MKYHFYNYGIQIEPNEILVHTKMWHQKEGESNLTLLDYFRDLIKSFIDVDRTYNCDESYKYMLLGLNGIALHMSYTLVAPSIILRYSPEKVIGKYPILASNVLAKIDYVFDLIRDYE